MYSRGSLSPKVVAHGLRGPKVAAHYLNMLGGLNQGESPLPGGKLLR